MSAPAAPLEKAVAGAREALAEYDGCKGYEADEYAMCCIEPFRLLLAALDADKRLERAEDLLRSASRHLFRDAPMSMAIHDYFARREEKNGGDRG